VHAPPCPPLLTLSDSRPTHMGGGLFGGSALLAFYFVIQVIGGVGLTVMLVVLAWPWRRQKYALFLTRAEVAGLMSTFCVQEPGPDLALL
jgi:hypothetical protein